MSVARLVAVAVMSLAVLAPARAGFRASVVVAPGFRPLAIAERATGVVVAGTAAGAPLVASMADDGRLDWAVQAPTGALVVGVAALRGGVTLVAGNGPGPDEAWLLAVAPDGMPSWALGAEGELAAIAAQGDRALAVGLRGTPLGFTICGPRRGRWYLGLDAGGVVDERWEPPSGSSDVNAIPTVVAPATGGFVVAGRGCSGWEAHGDAWAILVKDAGWTRSYIEPIESTCFHPESGQLVHGWDMRPAHAAPWEDGAALVTVRVWDACGTELETAGIGIRADGSVERRTLPAGMRATWQRSVGSWTALLGAELSGWGPERALWSLRGADDASVAGSSPVTAGRDASGRLVVKRWDGHAREEISCAPHELLAPPAHRVTTMEDIGGPVSVPPMHAGTWSDVLAAWSPASPAWSPCPSERCDAVGDEDGNGFADCDDAACAGSLGCDARDSDGDGVSDADDAAPFDSATRALPSPDPILRVERVADAVRLTWSGSDGATSWVVRSGAPGSLVAAEVLPVAVTATTRLDAGSLVSWIVRARNAAGETPDGAGW